jgi:hypothetical protein
MPPGTPSQVFEGAFADVPSRLLEASRTTVAATAELYLDGLVTVTQLQRRLVAGTPLQAVPEAVASQADAAREIVRAYVATGEQAVRDTREAAEVADEAATRVVRGSARAARKATKRSSTAARGAAKAQAAKARAVTPRAAKPSAARPPAAKPPAPKPPAATPAATPAARPSAPTTPAANRPEPPITGYDALTAEDLVARLAELSQAALAQVVAYEEANAARTTVLDRVTALTGPEPAPGYDELTVEEVQALLSGGDDALATAVREYERRHKGRAGVLEAAERRADAA